MNITQQGFDCLTIWARVPISDELYVPRQLALAIIIAGIYHRKFPEAPDDYFAAVSIALDGLDGFETFKARIDRRLADEPDDPPH